MSNRIISASSVLVNSNNEQIVDVNGVVDITTSGTLNVSDSTAQSSLSSIDSKVATASLQSTGNSSLSSIDGKVATATNQSTANSSLSSIDSRLSGTLATNVSQVGSSSISLGQTTMASSIPIVIASNQSALAVNSTNANNSGSAGNLNNASSVSSGDFSSEVDVRQAKNISITGTTTDASQNEIELHVAVASGGSKVKLGFSIYPDSNGNFDQTLSNVAHNYIYLKYTTSATVTAQAIFN